MTGFGSASVFGRPYGSAAPEEVPGTNGYLLTLLSPDDCRDCGIPDFNLAPKVAKSISYTATLTAQSEYLIWFTPHSRVRRIMLFTRNDPSSAWLYVGMSNDIQPEMDLSADFSADRFISGVLKIQSATLSAGTFAVTGQVWAVSYQNCPNFLNLDGSGIVSFRKDNTSWLANEPLSRGVVSVADPETDTTFRPSNTKNAVRSMRDGYLANFYWHNGTSPVPAGFTDPAGHASPFNVFDISLDNGLLPFGMRGKTRVSVQISRIGGVPDLDHFQNAVVSFINSAGIMTSYNTNPTHVTGSTGTTSEISLYAIEVVYDDVDILTEIFVNLACLNGTVGQWGGLDLSITVQNDTVATFGESSPGSIVIISGVDSKTVISLVGITNHEAIPNATLARNLKTKELVMDVPADIEAAKMVLANKPSFGFRSIYALPEYETLRSSGAFRAAATRGQIQGQAAGLFDALRGVGSVLFQAAKPLLREGATQLYGTVMSGLSAPAPQLGFAASEKRELALMGWGEAASGPGKMVEIYNRADVVQIAPDLEPAEVVDLEEAQDDDFEFECGDPPTWGEAATFVPLGKLTPETKVFSEQKYPVPVKTQGVSRVTKIKRPLKFTKVYKDWVVTDKQMIRPKPQMSASLIAQYELKDSTDLANWLLNEWQKGANLAILPHCESAEFADVSTGKAASLEEKDLFDFPEEYTPIEQKRDTKVSCFEDIKGYKTLLADAYQRNVSKKRLAFCMGFSSQAPTGEPCVVVNGVAIYLGDKAKKYQFALTALPWRNSPVADKKGNFKAMDYTSFSFTNVLGHKGVLYVESARFSKSAMESLVAAASRSFMQGGYITMISNDLLNGNSVGLAGYAAFSFWPNYPIYSGRIKSYSESQIPALGPIGEVNKKVTLEDPRPMVIATDEASSAYDDTASETMLLLDPRVMRSKKKVFVQTLAGAKLAAMMATTSAGITPEFVPEKDVKTVTKKFSTKISDYQRVATALYPSWEVPEVVDKLAGISRSPKEDVKYVNSVQALVDRVEHAGLTQQQFDGVLSGKLRPKSKPSAPGGGFLQPDSKIRTTELLRNVLSTDSISVRKLLELAKERYDTIVKLTPNKDELKGVAALAGAIRKGQISVKQANLVRALVDRSYGKNKKAKKGAGILFEDEDAVPQRRSLALEEEKGADEEEGDLDLVEMPSD